MSKIQIIIILIVLILLFTTYFKNLYKKPLINKFSKLLTLFLQYNKISDKTICESLQYITGWSKKVLKYFSLIFWIRYFVYKKYKHMGKFLNSNNYNTLTNFFFIYLMFFIDNCILYYNLLQTFYLYGLSFNFLIYLELKGFIIFIFNAIYSLSIGYLLKYVAVRCWYNSDFCYILPNYNKGTIRYCYVLFPFQMLSGPESIYHQGWDLINYYYRNTKFINIVKRFKWIPTLIFIWPHFYFVKLIYNLIRINCYLIYGYNNFHSNEILWKYMGKLIYMSNFITYYFIFLELFLLNIIVKIHPVIPILLYIVFKINILIKNIKRFYKKRKYHIWIFNKFGWEVFLRDTQKSFWEDYKGIGLFINKKRIYVNGFEETKYLLNRLNHYSPYFKYHKITWGFHKFTPYNNNLHLSFQHNKLINGLTTSSKYNNKLLLTRYPSLYPVNKINIVSIINKQYRYQIPHNIGELNIEEFSDWFSEQDLIWQIAIVQDFIFSVYNYNIVIPNEDWGLEKEELSEAQNIFDSLSNN